MSTAEQEIKTRQVPVTVVYDKNARATKPVVINEGGADSSKSYSIAQLLVQKFKNEYNKVVLVTCKTLPQLKLSAYKLVLGLLRDYGHYGYLKHNKSERTLYYRAHNNLMIFLSIEDPERIKSMEFNYIWMEEAGEFTWDDFINLRKCCRAKTKVEEPNRIYLSLNPVDELGWINDRLKKQSDVDLIHSTYKDNPFAQKADIDVLEGLKGQDDSYYRIYTLGLYAKLKGMIHEIIELDEFPELEKKETIYGIDYGFVNPSVLLKIDVCIEDMAIYMTELIYESGLTNTEFIGRMKAVVKSEDRQNEFYADSAEPARIEETYQSGFNCIPSDKGKKSVANGIDFLNRFTIYSLKSNVKTNRDFRGYKRKVDKNGHVLEEPVKFRDHSPNAARYALYTHLWERMIDMVPGWVWHRGMQKEEDEAEKEAKSNQRGKIEAVRVSADVELAVPKAKDKADSQDKAGKKEKQKRESDDDSWVL
ncbi:MAG: PBSX family phage terminase large subunit [Desulfobacteraceae bacterium]|nr:PBSX family phage terminase large subunit [Desulfobacteraceae bacterium]